MKNGLISIIVCVYNVEEYVERCLKSILNQSYKNIEIIIVDDGSSDNSSLIIKNFCNIDDRFHYYYKENGGLMSAYLYGLKHINGEYIGFVDPDDEIDIDMYKILYEEIIKHKCDITVCDLKHIDINTGEEYKDRKTEPFFVDENGIEELWKNVLPRPNSKYVSMSRVNKLFKKNIIVENIKYCEMDISRVMEDRRLIPACLWSSKRIYFTGKPLYKCYTNRTGSNSKKYIPDLLNEIHKIHAIHERVLKDKGIFDLCKTEYDESVLDFARIFMLRNIKMAKAFRIRIDNSRLMLRDKMFVQAISSYSGKKDKTLTALCISTKLKSPILLAIASLFMKE